jgi:hypothetical protein
MELQLKRKIIFWWKGGPLFVEYLRFKSEKEQILLVLKGRDTVEVTKSLVALCMQLNKYI